jgi:hypothetical protein
MSITFTKLFSSITESSVWFEPDHVRLAWITMLAMADRQGRVLASVPGLAHRARIELTQAQDAIATFMEPDEFSRTKEHEGRRIEEIDGGWRLLNYLKFRQLRDEEAAKESKRKYISNCRSKSKNISTVSTVEQCRSSLSPSLSPPLSPSPVPPSPIPPPQTFSLTGESPKATGLKFIAPGIEEVRLYFAKIGLPVTEAEGFLAHHAQRNWIPRGATRQMTSWHHAATTWKINWLKGAFDPRLQNGKPIPQEKSLLMQDIDNL